MRKKCEVCGLYRGAKPHTGTLHKKIMANRSRLRRGLSLRGTTRRKG